MDEIKKFKEKIFIESERRKKCLQQRFGIFCKVEVKCEVVVKLAKKKSVLLFKVAFKEIGETRKSCKREKLRLKVII